MTAEAPALSPLEMMAAGIMGSKVSKAAKLTPTPGEQAAAQEHIHTFAPFPYDQLDVLEGALAEVERQIEFIRTGLGLIRSNEPVVVDKKVAARFAGEEPPPSPLKAIVEEIVAEDRAAAEDLTERIARLSAEAQAATFTRPVATDDTEDEDPPGDGWQCPVHKKHMESKTRLGRVYRICLQDGCKEFERL